MTVVHLARHGETTWHEENRYAGRTDVELTDRGRAQAEAVGEWAASRPIAVVASSDLQRAHRSVEPVALRMGLEIVVDPRLREVDFGRAEGMPAEEVRSRWPKAWASFVATPATAPLPGGDLGADAAFRYAAALADLSAVATIAEGELLVVAHRTAMRLWLCHALGVPLDEYRRSFPRVGNGAVISVSLAADGLARLLSS